MRGSQGSLTVADVKGGLQVAPLVPRAIATMKELRDAAQLREWKAQTAAIAAYLAHRHNGPVKEVNAAVKLKAFAEHRLGLVLAETVDHEGAAGKPGPGRGKTGNTVLPVSEQRPKEVTKMQSSRAQQLAIVPWEEIEAKIDEATESDQRAKLGVIVAELQIRKRENEALGTRSSGDVEFCLCGDFREKELSLEEESVSLIFTDPPYDRKSLPLYEDLGRVARRVLRPGGSLLCYCGHYLLPDIIPLLARNLSYYWCCAVIHTGPLAKMREYGITVAWKPLLWFTNGPRTAADKSRFVLDGLPSGGKVKEDHGWQQSDVEARYYIESLTLSNELIFDPFAGSGTTIAAALALGRRACGVEKDAAKAALANGKACHADRAAHGRES